MKEPRHLIRIAPDAKPTENLAERVPTIGVVRLARDPKGRLIPMLRTWKPEVRLTKDLPAQLGIEIDYRTLCRLISAGFIRARRPAPRLTLVSIESLIEHLDLCRDPEFWEGENLERYQLAQAEGTA